MAAGGSGMLDTFGRGSTTPLWLQWDVEDHLRRVDNACNTARIRPIEQGLRAPDLGAASWHPCRLPRRFVMWPLLVLAILFLPHAVDLGLEVCRIRFRCQFPKHNYNILHLGLDLGQYPIMFRLHHLKINSQHRNYVPSRIKYFYANRLKQSWIQIKVLCISLLRRIVL